MQKILQTFNEVIKNFNYLILSTIFTLFEKLIERFSLVGNSPIFAKQQFDWVESLEANWSKIRQELDEILKYRDDLPNFQDISPEQYAITQDNRWKTYFLYGYGFKAEQNCGRCPETTKIIEQIPGITTAFFSILSPQKHIPKHRGYYKGVIRCHLGLIIPQPFFKCKMRVGNNVVFWQEGKALIFDDCYQHEIWNETDGIRAVLFFDVIRPLPFPLSVINHYLIKLIANSSLVKNGIKNQHEWDKKLGNTFSKVL
jgi:ornithine lipid ester-linked acyl 2-hydroxylase